MDNWSTDKSLGYISQFKKIKIIKSDSNLWISGGRNKLSKYSKWEFIFFIDNDIELIWNDFVSKLLSNYQSLKWENIWAIFPISVMENEKTYCNIWLNFSSTKKYKFHDIYRHEFKERAGFEWSASFIEKNVFEKLWWFDDKYPFCMNDSDLSMRLYNMWYIIFLDTNLYTIHHWIDTRDNSDSFWWKYQYYFCGFMRTITKNYTIQNLAKRWPISAIRIIIKSCKLSVKYHSFWPIVSTAKSISTFFRDLWDTLQQRKIIQKNRIIKKDTFLKIN